MKTEVIEAKEEHCGLLAAAMDDAGRDFIRRYWDVEPKSGLIGAFRDSALCWSILVDGEIVGMFGCTNEGQAWMTTAPGIERAKLRFIRQSGPYIQKMLDECGGSLYALAHHGNILLLKWLEWAGFEIVGRQGDFELCVCHCQYRP